MLMIQQELGQILGIISFRHQHDVSALPSIISSYIEWHISFLRKLLSSKNKECNRKPGSIPNMFMLILSWNNKWAKHLIILFKSLNKDMSSQQRVLLFILSMFSLVFLIKNLIDLWTLHVICCYSVPWGEVLNFGDFLSCIGSW